MCNDTSIKELLPAYLRQELAQPERDRVMKHLESCESCRAEISLLRMMAEEIVPDPGEAFWTEMPDRVFRAVQQHKARKWRLNLSWLAEWFILPRWAVAATAVGIVLMVVLLSTRSPQKALDVPVQEDEFAAEVPAVDPADTVHIRNLDRNQLDTVSTWANKELDSIAEEAVPAMVNNSEPDIYEELANLDTKEAERLSTMLDQWGQEG